MVAILELLGDIFEDGEVERYRGRWEWRVAR